MTRISQVQSNDERFSIYLKKTHQWDTTTSVIISPPSPPTLALSPVETNPVHPKNM